MMNVVEQQNVYEVDFGALQERTPPDAAWLRDLRERGLAHFKQQGFPTTRDEEWRFTNVQPIATTAFVTPNGAQPAASISERDIERFGFGGVSAARLVFIDGRYEPGLSRVGRLPGGIQVASLAAAVAEGNDVVAHHLGRYDHGEHDAFDALNTAFIEDGAFIRIGRSASLDAPIHLLFVSTAADQPQVTHPRNLIVAEEGGRATIVENYVAASEGVYFSNAVTELSIGPRANIAHYLLERDSEQAYNVSTLRIHQERDSHLESHTALLGGAIVRNNIHAELHGTGAWSMINGLYMPRGSQHHDNHMRIVHAAPHCQSRQFYKGVLNDKSRAVFSGRIVVQPEGQQTDAKQSNRNLLLSDAAQTNTRPQLEIYADDVKCTHGATTGQIDPDQLFYLKARGLDEQAARSLLVYAFAHESLDRMTIEPIRRTLEQAMMQRLPQSKMLRKLI